MKLYEIDRNIREVTERLINQTQELAGSEYKAECETSLPDDLENMLDALKISKAEKVEGIGCLIKELTADAEAIKEEVKALTTRQGQKEAKIEYLRRYLMVFGLAEGEKFETSKVGFSWRRSESVQVISADDLPDDLVRVKTIREPEKDLIKQRLKAGEEIKGCSLVVKHNLQVK